MKLKRAELALLLMLIMLCGLAWVAGTHLAEELLAGVDVRRDSLIFVQPQSIANATRSDQVLRIREVGLESFAQADDKIIDGAWSGVGFVAPDFGDDVAALNHTAVGLEK